MSEDVWAIAEHDGGRLDKTSFELLCEGLRVAKALGKEISAVLIGDKVDHLVEEIGLYGVDNIYLAKSEKLAQFEPNLYVDLIEQLAAERRPEIILFGATLRGKAVAPALAARVDAGLVTNCDFLDIGPAEGLIASKSIYGGKFSARYELTKGPIIVTFVPGVLGYDKPSSAKPPAVIEVKSAIGDKRSNPRVLRSIEADPETIDLRDAEVIVDAGRGVGKEENFKILKEFASLIGAPVGGTRAAVDNKWLPHERLIGQTGKVVAPRVLILCGVSGAIQHLEGIKNSEFIVAINTDANAPIFKVADIGIVGDVNQVIPRMGQELSLMISKMRPSN